MSAEPALITCPTKTRCRRASLVAQSWTLQKFHFSIRSMFIRACSPRPCITSFKRQVAERRVKITLFRSVAKKLYISKKWQASTTIYQRIDHRTASSRRCITYSSETLTEAWLKTPKAISKLISSPPTVRTGALLRRDSSSEKTKRWVARRIPSTRHDRSSVSLLSPISHKGEWKSSIFWAKITPCRISLTLRARLFIRQSQATATNPFSTTVVQRVQKFLRWIIELCHEAETNSLQELCHS